MENVYNELLKECKDNINMLVDKLEFAKFYINALENLEKQNFDIDKKIEVLLEMYKLSIYGIETFLDPRYEKAKKMGLLNKLSICDDITNLEKFLIELKELNSKLQENIENHIKYVDGIVNNKEVF